MSERHDSDPVVDPAHRSGPGPAPDEPPTTAYAAVGATPATAPDYTPRRVAVRRPDVLGGLLLLLAGAAAGISLLLRWLPGNDTSGLDLVRRGFDDLSTGLGELVGTGFWQPLTVVLGGAVLAVLGLLLFLPARRHRVLGVLALLVAAAVTAAVLVPLFRSGWDLGTFDVGFWVACAVAVLGLLGALKALLTGTRTSKG